nr:hypothetical protein [uncultured Desulfobacter sp.]
MDNQSPGSNGYALPAGTDISELNRDDAEEVNIDMPGDSYIDSFSQSL